MIKISWRLVIYKMKSNRLRSLKNKKKQEDESEPGEAGFMYKDAPFITTSMYKAAMYYKFKNKVKPRQAH